MKKTVYAVTLCSAFVTTLGGIAVGVAADLRAPNANTTNVMDARRETQILTSYGMNPLLHALDLSVSVRGDEAFLGGYVQDRIASDLAEQIAMDVAGIVRVDNGIRVDADYAPPQHSISDRSFGERVGDATTTASVRSRLLWNSNTAVLDIHVNTVRGSVTLTGSADSNAQKNAAARIARDTDGVVSLDNEIALTNRVMAAAKIGPTGTQTGQLVSDAWITSKVKSSLMLTRNMNSFDIAVMTIDGVVSLNGEVDTAAQRERAVRVAQDIRGVKKVDAGGLNAG